MIISKTPLRVSFTGGGSDLSAYYAVRAGAVTSVTVNQYMYVTVNRRFDDTVRLSYSTTEIVGHRDELRHEIAREAMRIVGLESGVEITTIADVPAGTGLGSSSSLSVGLLNALYAFTGRHASADRLAREACRLEIDVLRKPIGKQDQYAAAFGGMNHFRFHPDESVFVEPVISAPGTKAALQDRLLMFYTGLRGDNTGLLDAQRAETSRSVDKRRILDRMVELAGLLREALSRDDLADFGALLHENWELKKQMAAGITNPEVDRWYEIARAEGALGGKILGAGGSGFLLLYCEEARQPRLRAALGEAGLREFSFRFESQGSRIIYVGD
jgi:D-glycero-alpha-D-manno-heptose-7-phosphate kinase